MLEWITERWDWMVYRWSRATMRRLAAGNGGFVYLHYLDVADVLVEHPLGDDLKKAAETFHDALGGRFSSGHLVYTADAELREAAARHIATMWRSETPPEILQRLALVGAFAVIRAPKVDDRSGGVDERGN